MFNANISLNRTRLYNIIAILETIHNSDSPPAAMYNEIFTRAREFSAAYTNVTGNVFDWYDPDTSYEEDVEYFMRAVIEERDRIFGDDFSVLD